VAASLRAGAAAQAREWVGALLEHKAFQSMSAVRTTMQATYDPARMDHSERLLAALRDAGLLLASAQLVTHAAATANPADVYGAGAVAMVEPVSFKDRLSFLIPAGVYANDLRLRGFAAGSLQAGGCQNGVPNSCANGCQDIWFHIGGSYGAQDYTCRLDVNPEGTSSQLLGDRFTLDIKLLPAGTFESDVSVDVAVEAYMISKGMALNTNGYPLGASATMFAADFEAAFTDLEVTGVMAAQARAANGITCTSASSVFLTQPVPEPGTWSMLMMGGLATAVAVRRRQRR
jgi:hypothetical protein